MSIETVSPSRIAAIGPPTQASGATWPTISPREAPEKRPSVRRATVSPTGPNDGARHTEHFARMPGPPSGPSYRITTTSPGLMRLAVTASIASSSAVEDARRALVFKAFVPATLMTQPSGARLPSG